MVSEAGSETQGSTAAAVRPLPWQLRQACMLADGAVDRLGLAREVAQIGAGIGRQFRTHHPGGGTKPEQELATALDRLVAAGRLAAGCFASGESPSSTLLCRMRLRHIVRQRRARSMPYR